MSTRTIIIAALLLSPASATMAGGQTPAQKRAKACADAAWASLRADNACSDEESKCEMLESPTCPKAVTACKKATEAKEKMQRLCS